MRVHLINPNHLSYGIGVITPRWLYVLAAATPAPSAIRSSSTSRSTPWTRRAFEPGDLVGIGIHTGNALRGYEVGRMARERGAYVVFGGFMPPAYGGSVQLGGAHAVVKGDGDVVWSKVAADCANGGPQPLYEGGRIEGRVPARAVGPHPARQLHVGFGADGARVSQALLVLLRVAHGWAEAAPARYRCGDPGDRRAAAGFRFIALADDNFYPVTLRTWNWPSAAAIRTDSWS